MTETVDLIENLITNWGLKLNITKVDNFVTSFKIYVCNTYYISKDFQISIDGNSYLVVSVENNVSITISGGVLPLVGLFAIDSPYYFNGTIKQTSGELNLISDVFQKTPLIYLRRTFSESFNDLKSAISHNSEVTLYFLTQASFESWNTSEFDTNAIEPMRNTVYAFIELLNKRRDLFGKITTYQLTDVIKFASTASNGYESKLFNESLSGVELSISLPIKRGCKNCCC
jgi:hypothetical protein